MKPLSDWTLGEVKERCAGANGRCKGENCELYCSDEEMCALIGHGQPREWTLNKPTFTDREKEVLRYIQEVHKAEYVLRKENGAALVSMDRPIKGEDCWFCASCYIAMPHNWFPGLPPDTVVKISEVVGDE